MKADHGTGIKMDKKLTQEQINNAIVYINDLTSVLPLSTTKYEVEFDKVYKLNLLLTYLIDKKLITKRTSNKIKKELNFDEYYNFITKNKDNLR